MNIFCFESVHIFFLLEVKRSDEETFNNEEQWLDNPVKESVGLGAMLEGI